MWVTLTLGLLLAAPADEDQVISFKGLLELEQRGDVSDARKEAEWTAFVERTEAQLDYARKAIVRWKNAERQRLLAEALALDADPAASAVDKEKAWLLVAANQPSEDEASKANARAAHWHQAEAKRLVQRARAVEEEGASKGERIAAWLEVVAWAEPGDLRAAAQARVSALQARLVQEARTLDGVARVDDATKMAAWQAVLEAEPTPEQAAEAQRRIAALGGRPRR